MHTFTVTTPARAAMSDLGTKPEKLEGGIQVTNDGEANFYGLAAPGNWIARIQMNGEIPAPIQRELVEHMAAALTSARWGQEPTATVQLSVELDADFIDSVLIGMTEQGYPWFDWTDIEQTTFASNGKTVARMSAAVATEVDPDEGTPTDDAKPVRVDGPAIAAAIGRLLSEPDLAGDPIRDDLARAVCERDAGHIDVNVADCIAQIAVLGEIRYG